MDLLAVLKIPWGKRLTGILTGVLLSWSAWVQPAVAASPEMVNVGVATQGNYVTMNAILTDGFSGKIQEAIDSGVPMTFTFHIELRQQVSLWADSLIRSNTVSHTVQYDSLKKIYKFSEVGKNVKRKIITRKKDRLQKLMFTLQNIPITPIYRLDPNEKYYVRVKADLEMDRFWFPFNYLFFFVPFNDFETTWAQTSAISIDPALLLKEASHTPSPSKKGKNPKGLNHVIRSFNQ